MSEQRPEWEDRKILISETLLRQLINRAYPDDIVQLRFPPPTHQYIEFYEPVVTVAYRLTPVEVIDNASY